MHLSPGVYNDGNLKVGGRWYFSLGSLYHCQLVLWYVIYKHCEAFRELLSGIFSGVTIMFLNWYKLLSLIIACATSLQQWHVKGSFYNTSFMRSVILFLGGLLFLVWGGGGWSVHVKVGGDVSIRLSALVISHGTSIIYCLFVAWILRCDFLNCSFRLMIKGLKMRRKWTVTAKMAITIPSQDYLCQPGQAFLVSDSEFLVLLADLDEQCSCEND